jgi:hypothetical protein
MGYKEFCIQMSNEHMGLLEVRRENGRPELQIILRKPIERTKKMWLKCFILLRLVRRKIDYVLINYNNF